MRKKVALVLSGGSALGFSHIGVIKTLEKYGVPIDMIVGTSMGALVGACYCAGMKTSDMEKFAQEFKKTDLMDLNFDKKGLFSGKGVMKRINNYIPDINIEALDREYACVACDLAEEKEIVFKTGSLRDAVRASMSIPGVFVPLSIDDKSLIDGGVINNLPEDVAVEMGADVIISVDCLTKCKLHRKPKNAGEILFYAINVCIKEIQKLKSYHADVLLQPNTKDLTLMGFGKTNTIKCIREGVIETEKNIQKILSLIK